jgi:hypothetical protein
MKVDIHIETAEEPDSLKADFNPLLNLNLKLHQYPPPTGDEEFTSH